MNFQKEKNFTNSFIISIHLFRIMVGIYHMYQKDISKINYLIPHLKIMIRLLYLQKRYMINIYSIMSYMKISLLKK